MQTNNYYAVELTPEYANSQFILLGGYTDYEEFYLPLKGWCSAFLLLNDLYYPLFFYDLERAKCDLDRKREKEGEICIAERGMILVHKVTLENMIALAKQLIKEKYFDTQKSISKSEFDDIFQNICRMFGL